MRNKWLVLLAVLAMNGLGIYSLKNIALDAVPDITNNQVQIVTYAPTLAAQEVEQYITVPLEMSLANIPFKEEVRSISRYGLSVITVVFDDDVDIMRARQFVTEQISTAKEQIPAHFGVPELMPITTGLGEIYQYLLQLKPGYESKYTLSELRTIQDWIVRRQLMGTPGIIDVNSFGGLVKQYEVSANPTLLAAYEVSLQELAAALQVNNANSGGSYIESGKHAFYIRTEGRVQSEKDIENIIIKPGKIPIRVKDVASVKVGHPKRYGAMTMDGKGEVVGGITLMLKGENSYATVRAVKERMAVISKNLPEGVELIPYLDRSELIGKTIDTVIHNLAAGGAIVILVLILFLGNWRAGLVVASVIPMSMLFAFIGMRLFQVSANLMSLGAIDFGIVVDGAVIISEGVLAMLAIQHSKRAFSQADLDKVVVDATRQLYSSASFGMIIILVVLLPVYTLRGIEGKTFLPMVQTVSFAIIGALVLSVTYVPVMLSLILDKKSSSHTPAGEAILSRLKKWYLPVLIATIKRPAITCLVAFGLFLGALFLLNKQGAEFIPTLEEGDMAMQLAVPPGSSLQHSINTATTAEQLLLKHFPEVKHVISKIGTAEIPTDPMGIEDCDIMIIMKDKSEWTHAENRNDMVASMKEVLASIPNVSIEFSQPIQLRFNELMTGTKADVAIKIFGENMSVLRNLADSIAAIIKELPGAGDVKVEQTAGLRQLNVHIDRQQLLLHGVSVEDVNFAIRSAYSGEVVGKVFEQERSFDLVVRVDAQNRESLNLSTIMLKNSDGVQIPLSLVAKVEEARMPMQISREDARRRITVGVNVRDTDVAGLVSSIQKALKKKIQLPPGYFIQYGGQYENLNKALERLAVVLPVALILIFVLLYLAFANMRHAFIILLTVPMSSIGGVAALWVRDMPFSISAGIGFIALFGVAVLDGIVIISEMNRMRKADATLDLKHIAQEAALHRLRPVLMTSLVATLGFLPMALSNNNGAEVQRPLATVVIGGLISSTLLTLLILPSIYVWLEQRFVKADLSKLVIMALLTLWPTLLSAQKTTASLSEITRASLANRAEIKLTELEKQYWHNESKYAYTLSPMQFDLQQGQNDGPEFDHFVTITQDFGVPWSVQKRKEYAALGLKATEYKQKATIAQVQYSVSASYYQYMYHRWAIAALQSIDSGLALSTRSVRQLHESGQINFVDYLSIKQLNTTLKQKVLQHSSGILQQIQVLRYLSGIRELEPSDTILHLIELPRLAELNPILSASQSAITEQLNQKQELIQKSYLPGFYAGGFTQSLGNVRGYMGIKAGLYIPIVATGKQKALTANKLEWQGAMLELENLKLKLETEQKVSYSTCISIYNLIPQPFTGSGEIQKGYQQLWKKYTTGEINAIDYVRMAAILAEGALSEADIINQYNQAVLKYRYLTQMN
jgi:cobalt-zinc-cadmium resistance protein CzcA